MRLTDLKSQKKIYPLYILYAWWLTLKQIMLFTQ